MAYMDRRRSIPRVLGFGRQASRNLLAKTNDELVSLFRIVCQNNHLREIRIWEFGIVGEPETKATSNSG